MDGKKYEQRVALYLRNHGFKKVSVTKASNDYGVDIICYKHRKKYAVQCKYYSKPVGVHAVQEVVGGMRYYDCDRGMVVTNNTYTRQAVELADRNDVILVDKLSGKTSFRKVYINIIVLLLLLNFLLTEYRVYAAVALALFGLFHIFGVYVRYQHRREVELNSDDSEEEIEDVDEEFEE